MGGDFMAIEIKYNARGDPVAVKIDRDGWIRNKGTWPVGYFRQIVKRALEYNAWQKERSTNK